jgi:hypothetical protein
MPALLRFAAAAAALALASCATPTPAGRRLSVGDVADLLKAATADKKTARSFYQSLPTGQFRGQAQLVWIGANRFRFLNPAIGTFEFVPAQGRPIVPGDMETDGGSVPRQLWLLKGYSPWDYAPAYIVHDWLFERHHAQDPAYADITLQEAGLIMASGIKTLMEAPLPSGVKDDPVPANPDALYRIYKAVTSKWADGLWDRYHVPGLPRTARVTPSPAPPRRPSLVAAASASAALRTSP